MFEHEFDSTGAAPPDGHPATGHPATGHPATGHPATGHPATEHPATEHRATEHPGAEYAAGDQGPAADVPPDRHPVDGASSADVAGVADEGSAGQDDPDPAADLPDDAGRVVDRASGASDGSAPADNPVAGALADLDTLGDRDLAEHPEVFERIHGQLHAALSAIDDA